MEAEVEHWRRRLAGAPATVELPTDRPRPAVQSFHGGRMPMVLSRDLSARLRGLAQRSDATLFMVLLAAYNVLLKRYTGQNDILVGTPVAGRVRSELGGLIGFFVNALPVRLQLDGDPDVAELLARIRSRLLDVMAHEELPFELIVKAAERGRDGNRNPLFQVQLVLQAAVNRFELQELGLEVTEIDTHTAKRDLKDGQVGLVAYEINFNRHFYRYAAPRPLEEIEADLHGSGTRRRRQRRPRHPAVSR